MATITGTDSDDILGGTSGDDTITGHGGKDSIFGGDGNDTIETGPENSTPPRVGSDSGYRPPAADTAFGGNGDDAIRGGQQDILFGDGGNDTISLDEDLLFSLGLAYAFGGDGNDTISTRLTNAHVDGGTGNDTFDIRSFYIPYLLDSLNGPRYASDSWVTTGAGADSVKALGRVTITDFTVSGPEADRLDFSGLSLGTADTFGRDDGPVIYQDGADAIIRTPKLDLLNASIGAYQLDLRLQNVNAATLTAANLGANPGSIWIAGGTAADTLAGTAGNDRLHGFEGNDTINGGDGDDLIFGGIGADTVTGGAGADRFAFTVHPNSGLDPASGGSDPADDVSPGDTITDFQTGIDKIELVFYFLTAEPQASIAISDGGIGHSQVTVTIGTQVQTIDVNGAVAMSDIVTPGLITGTAGNDTLVGTNGDEIMIGLGGSDTLSGGDGNDRIYGDTDARGHDGGNLLDGGAGDDSLTGSLDNDVLIGGLGNDFLYGAAGLDSLSGGPGNDTFYFRGGDSTANAFEVIQDFGDGADQIDLRGLGPSAVAIVQLAGGGSIVFTTSTDGPLQVGTTTTLQGTSLSPLEIGVDVIGTASADTVIGTAKGDQLFGNDGADTLQGGAGGDVLYGGAGADIFKYSAPADSVAGASDLIADFQTGIDKIDLRGAGIVNVGIAPSGANSFVFGTTANGAVMQIGVLGAVALSDILTGAAPAPAASQAVAPETASDDAWTIEAIASSHLSASMHAHWA